jgi:hypothetical protein
MTASALIAENIRKGRAYDGPMEEGRAAGRDLNTKAEELRKADPNLILTTHRWP